MKILAIGDLHGKEIWKQALSTIDADHIVFVGDYINAKQWIFNSKSRLNLKALINLKQENFERVHLLLGNHDIAYLNPSLFPESRLRRLISAKMFRLYHDNKQCFDVAYQHNQYLFTHAGISRFWYKKHKPVIDTQPGDTIAKKINLLQHSNMFKILHEKGRARGGRFDYGGITYADKVETEKNGIEGYTQVVGHTKVKQPILSRFPKDGMIYIDCLNSVHEFLYINDNKISVINIQGQQRPLLDT